MHASLAQTVRAFFVFVFALVFGRLVAAQCDLGWSPEVMVGLTGQVTQSTLWDPDGSGPLPERVALVTVGTPGKTQVLSYEPTTGAWSTLGLQFNNQILCLAALADGGLVAGGAFTQVGGVAVSRLARWDGVAWHPMGAGASGEVKAVAGMSDGAVIAGGDFSTLGFGTNVARWDGLHWQAIGVSPWGTPRDLCVMPNGDLVAGGWFSQINGVLARGVARWDGTTWHPMGQGLFCMGQAADVDALTISAVGEVYGVGTYHPPFGYPISCVSRWNGAAWIQVGSGPIGVGGNWNVIWELAALPNGELAAAGNFTIGGVERFVAHWNGSSWSPMSSGVNSGVSTLLALPGGDLLVGGNFTMAGSLAIYWLARWDGLAWLAVGGAEGPPNGIITAVAALPTGGFVVGGDFLVAGGRAANHVAVWQDGIWSPLGTGVGDLGPVDRVTSVVVMPNGDIVAAGYFPQAGSTVVNHVARWDGLAWHALGGGITGGYGYTWIDDMLVMPNGDLIVAGRFYGPVPWLARWDGTTWSSLGQSWEGIEALALAPNGDLLVAYNQAGGARVMRWNGATWTQVGLGSVDWRVFALDVDEHGTVVAGGMRPSVTKWSGSQWTVVGGPFGDVYGLGPVLAIECLPNGDILAGGAFTQPGNNIARWNGASWQPLGNGVDGRVEDLCLLATSQLAVAGSFMPHVKLLSSTCPASATSYGVGCSGGAGPVSLMATQWPMLGGSMRGRTTGLTSNSLAVGVFGFSQINVPLSSGHPAGLPGCNVLVADEILIEFLVGAGAVESRIEVPSNGNLIGSSFHHQVVPVELEAGASIRAITSSNALTLTIGSF